MIYRHVFRFLPLLIQVETILIPVLLALCAVFAAGEASLLSLNRIQLEQMRVLRPAIHRRIWKLISSPDALLSTVIVSNETLTIFLGISVASIVQRNLPDLSTRWAVLISALVSTVLLLMVSEVLPKVLAFRLPMAFASALVFPLSLAHWLVTPFRKVFSKVADTLVRFGGIKPEPPAAISEIEFLTMVEVGMETGTLEREEKDLIVNVFRFSDLTVQSVMTPWNQILSINDKMTVTQVLSEIRKRVFSRIPVVSTETGAVVGVLYTKALLKLLLAPDEPIVGGAANQAVLPPYIVSVTTKIATLFKEFNQKKLHFALVVDEFGKHLGVVTLDDLLNALFQTRKKGLKGAA